MEEFSTRQKMMFASFDLSEEEQAIFDRYYKFLDESGVAEVIKRTIQNDTQKGGRPNVNYFNLFAAILYGFSCGRSTLRDLSDACGHDIRYIDIMQQVRPSYTTIANFFNSVIVPYEEEIYGCINRQILKEMSIALEDVFIDGTKWEANANKYKFVWKPITYHKKISVTFFDILQKNNLCASFDREELVRSSTITKAIDALESSQDQFEETIFQSLRKALGNILVKVLEYEEKERICGEGRESYYKTDHDATAMCLKADYYTGKGSNLHAAYNVQAAVVKGMVVSYCVSQHRADISDFIPTLEKMHKIYGEYPKNVCADAGYGSLQNYRFLEMNAIGNYVKHQSWEGNVSGSYPDAYRLNEDESITCLNGNRGSPTNIPGRHPKHEGGVFYRVDGCMTCAYKDYCMRFMKNTSELDHREFEVSVELARLKQKAEANLLSRKGIEIRVNRSVQVEGVFGIEKQDIQYVRTRRRGIQKVSSEIMMMFLGLNIKRLLQFFKTGKILQFWVAPEDLQPEQFKKPSAKRLSKKGKKISAKLYNI